MELVLNPAYRGWVTRGGFDNTLQQPFALQDIFQHFRKLRLGFSIVDNLVEKHIAQTLSTATNLKSLCVNAVWDGDEDDDLGYRPGGPTSFQEIVGECEFPRLKCLMLEGFDSTEAELVRFLRGSSHLQRLTLTHHILRGKDKWKSCANGIKIALPNLEHISVNALISDDGGQDFRYNTHYCSPPDVLGFFLQGRANPFVDAETQNEPNRIVFITVNECANHWPPRWPKSRSWWVRPLPFH